MLMAVLEGRAPARRPHHVVELAVVVMSRRRSSEIILHLGGLGAKKNNLSIITVLVGVLCATNGTQHQQRHRYTTRSSEQPIFSLLTRARTRNDAWDHASPIVHARLATHRPHLPSKAQHCTMSGKTLCSLPHTAASQHTREGL